MVAALSRLPRTYTQIAAFLETEGIRGIPCSLTCDPLARWLRRELEIPHATVNGEVAVLTFFDGDTVRVDLRKGIERFIEVFDDYGYPELVDNEGASAEEGWDIVHYF